jgi:hypothetical protein
MAVFFLDGMSLRCAGIFVLRKNALTCSNITPTLAIVGNSCSPLFSYVCSFVRGYPGLWHTQGEQGYGSPDAVS